MGKFTPKAGFDGKTVNGTVVSSNKNGAILRGRTVPIVRDTPSSSEVKNRFSAVARLWSSLSESVKSDWEALEFQGASGYELFQLCNLNKQVLGESPSSDLPYDTGTRTYTAGMVNTPPDNLLLSIVRDTTGYLYSTIIYASPLVPLGRSVPPDNEFRIIQIQPNLRTEVLDIREAYESVFGEIIPGGVYSIYVYTELIRTEIGLRFNRQESSVVVNF